MGLTIATSGAMALGENIWLVDLPPHQLRFFGGGTQSCGARSVIAIKNAQYDDKTKSLKFDADDVTTLNIGTLTETVAVGVDSPVAKKLSPVIAAKSGNISYGPGDRAFLNLVNELMPEHMKRAALLLLEKVRHRSSGDLKRGKARNFSETPDNFWYVIVQPQVEHLQITVRGDLQHFHGMSTLPILDDRGNTRFKVTKEDDVEEALKLIFHAKRMNR
ncbi:MAG: hypothetical protein KGJ49_03970 [Alphaproteobacteria bacterium]|nr:hypothetical protein [Alphaproteobacteria bacterium]